MADEENLVSRRPRRSTAGNRMELALAELALEEPQEPEEDVDFVDDKEEEDVFESDFASTDEEAVQDGVDVDRAVREEEKRERKTTRARVEKATAAAHARQRVAFNPEATSSQSKAQLTHKPKRRVSLGIVVNAETGEVIEGGSGTVGAKRQSQRSHTIMNTSATVNRIKDAEEKRAAIPKKAKTITRLPTQDELIARALNTEEGNITEHRNYLRLEEEKRAKARVIKKSIEGPVLRWVSRKETIQVEVRLPSPLPPTGPAASANLYAGKYSFVYTSGIGTGAVGYTPIPPPATSSNIQDSASSMPSASASSQQQQPQTQTQFPAAPSAQTQPQSLAQYLPSPILLSYPSISAAPLIAHRSEDVCKNYVIHELSQSIPSKPPWKDTMSAMFGDHVQWDEVKVFTSKGRPLARPVRMCPVTGQPAKYRDPRTNVPFADVGAYGVLTRILGREYVWCSALGCYVGVAEIGRAGKNIGPGEDAEGSEDKTMASKADESGAGGDGDIGHYHEIEGRDEPSLKRRRIGMAEG